MTDDHVPAIAFVIGLDEGYRGEPLEHDLATRGFDVRRSNGVLVSQADMADPNLYDAVGARVVMRRMLTAGEVGCALAHRVAAQRLLDSGAGVALVCEDDARPQGDWDAGSLPWGVLGVEPAVVSLFSHGARTAVAGPDPVLRAPWGTVWRACTPPLTTTAYLINRAAAELLSQESPVRYVADWPAEFAARVAFSVAYPWLVQPAGDDLSTLEVARAQTPPVDRGSTGRKLMRHLAAASHVTWIRHRGAFGNDYRTYVFHEFTRLVSAWRARRFGTPIVPGNPGAPRKT